MYKHILAAVDDGAAREHVLSEATDLAQKYEGTIRVIHVLVKPAAGGAPRGKRQRLARTQEGEQIVADSLSYLRERGHASEAILSEADREDVARFILDHATHWPADVIVVGTHPRKTFDKPSVTRELIVHGSIPVLCVKPTRHAKSLRSVSNSGAEFL